MKRFFAAVVLGACALPLVIAPTVRGQTPAGSTPTPTPTPAPTLTPTSTLPPGQQLLTIAGQNLLSKGSAHVEMVLKLVQPKQLRIVEKLHLDISFRNNRMKASGTLRITPLNTSPRRTISGPIALVVVGQKAATRTGKQKWTCASSSQVSQTATSLAVGAQYTTPVNLGLETVNGVPAWHVRVKATVTASGQTLPITEDAYIAQADNTYVRQTAAGTFTAQGSTVKETLIEDYSKYGEPVHAKLPKACRSTALRVSRLTSWLALGWLFL